MPECWQGYGNSAHPLTQSQEANFITKHFFISDKSTCTEERTKFARGLQFSSQLPIGH